MTGPTPGATPAPADPASDRDAHSAALRITGLSKAFGGTQALDQVSFDVKPGTIHALVGGNGCGKSTLIKILAGVERGDAGTVCLGQDEFDVSDLSPRLAQQVGLHFVHQQNSTFASLSVADNLAIGRGFETRRWGAVRDDLMRARSERVLARFDVKCDPDQPLSTLSPAARMVVAIARALQDQEDARSGILVLDEPTAALPKQEVDLLLSSLQRFAQAGQSILYVTHRLEEVVSMADRVTVLRDGRVAATVEDFDHRTLASLITGRETVAPEQAETPPTDQRVPILTVEDVVVGPVRGASFTLYQGEVLGIAGILGSGRSALLRALFGVSKIESGVVRLNGKELRLRHPADAVKAGMALIPEDRRGEASFETLDVSENIFPANLQEFWRRGRLDGRRERRRARDLMTSFFVKAASDKAPFSSLSGGNQQKAILARWLCHEPQVILLDEPTQGVDIGARVDIWNLVRGSLDNAAVIVVSSDFEELASACDRVLVLRGGELVGTCRGSELTEERLNELAYAGEMQVHAPLI